MSIFFAYLADILMILASLGAACYCLILSRRLSRLTSFDKGIGGAIAVLSAQVDDMKSALAEAKAGSDGAGQHLHELVRQARDISGELEMMIAACHDFAEEALTVQGDGRTTPDTAAMTSAATPGPTETQDPGPPAAEMPVPTFGSRRTEAPAPVFRHRSQAQA
jgi:hypothetical protein